MDDDWISKICDGEWGATFSQCKYIDENEHVHLCLVEVSDIQLIATKCIEIVNSKSWMSDMSPRKTRAYRKTVDETSALLSKIFNRVVTNSSSGSSSEKVIAEDFGEMMVSISSGYALKLLLGHIALPVAELWKPQVKGNEGFDFHTTCPYPLINFGEAKFSGSTNPHGKAIPQIRDFLEEEKHLRDTHYLESLTDSNVMGNLDQDLFGVVIAFSVNSHNPLKILKNAMDSAVEYLTNSDIQNVYIVGVKHQ